MPQAPDLNKLLSSVSLLVLLFLISSIFSCPSSSCYQSFIGVSGFNLSNRIKSNQIKSNQIESILNSTFRRGPLFKEWHVRYITVPFKAMSNQTLICHLCFFYIENCLFLEIIGNKHLLSEKNDLKFPIFDQIMDSTTIKQNKTYLYFTSETASW